MQSAGRNILIKENVMRMLEEAIQQAEKAENHCKHETSHGLRVKRFAQD
jgi:hypothetical protein